MNAPCIGIQLARPTNEDSQWTMLVDQNGNVLSFSGSPENVTGVHRHASIDWAVKVLAAHLNDGYRPMAFPSTFQADLFADPADALASFLASGPAEMTAAQRRDPVLVKKAVGGFRAAVTTLAFGQTDTVDTFDTDRTPTLATDGAGDPIVYGLFVGTIGNTPQINSLHITEDGANKRKAEREAEPMTEKLFLVFSVEPIVVED